MILFLFLLLVVVALGILSFRRQSYFQHREMMRATNPEYMARIEAEERAKANKVVKVYVIILIAFGLLGLLALCGQLPFKGFIPDSPRPVKSESNQRPINLDPLKPNPGTFPNN